MNFPKSIYDPGPARRPGGYVNKPFNAQPLPKGGDIVPYHSPLNPGLGKPHSQPALPPAGGSTPPNGIRVQPNTFTNTKPNLGQPFNPNSRGAKGNVNSNSGGIGGGAAAAAGGIARAGGAAAAGGGAAPFIVGAVGFGVGVALGNTIYEEAENPDSIVFKGLDVIDRKLKGGDQYKLGNESKTRSRGGVQISPEILPFQGGQTDYVYGITAEVAFKNYNPDGSLAGEGSGQMGLYIDGPISSISIKSDGPGTYYYVEAKGGDRAIAKGHLGWADNTNIGIRTINKFNWRNIFRTDGTTLQNDIVQGGNPNPDQVGTSEPRTTTNITNNTTNNITNVNNNYPSPPPFADPPPQAWPPPPAIKPNPKELGLLTKINLPDVQKLVLKHFPQKEILS